MICNNYCDFSSVIYTYTLTTEVGAVTTQVGFAELKETADDRANIGGTIIGAPIVG